MNNFDNLLDAFGGDIQGINPSQPFKVIEGNCILNCKAGYITSTDTPSNPSDPEIQYCFTCGLESNTYPKKYTDLATKTCKDCYISCLSCNGPDLNNCLTCPADVSALQEGVQRMDLVNGNECQVTCKEIGYYKNPDLETC